MNHPAKSDEIILEVGTPNQQISDEGSKVNNVPLSKIEIWPVTKDVRVLWNLRLPDPTNLGIGSISTEVVVLEVTVSEMGGKKLGTVTQI